MSSAQVPAATPTAQEAEQRQDGPRQRSLFLVHYELYDVAGRSCGQGMGRTLDISEGGLLLETDRSIARGCDIALTLGMEERLIGVLGRVLRCVVCDGRHRSGVEFLRPDPATRRRLAEHILLVRSLRERESARESSNEQ